jgi:hypothetical protein
MPVPDALAHYDEVRNILFVDKEEWGELTPEQQRAVKNCEGTIAARPA